MWSVDSFGLGAAWDDGRSADALGRAPCAALHTARRPSLAAPASTALGALETAAQLQDAGYVPANGAVYPDTRSGRRAAATSPG